MAVKAIKDWAYIPIAQIILLVAVLLIAWFVHNHSPNDLVTLNNYSIAISTLLFGFLTLSLTMHLEELRRQKESISDLAAELLTILNKVRKNPSMSHRKVHFNTKYWHYGIDGFGASGEAEEVIGEAYDYLLKNMREVVHLCRVLIFAWAFPALLLLFSSITASLLSQYMSLNNELVGGIDLVSILFGGVAIILGWWESNKRLDKNCDSIFNIRHTILSDLCSGDSHLGYG